jgi:hypothetical protein
LWLQEEVKAKYPQLHSEYDVYKSIPPTEGIPKVYHFSATQRCAVMVMERLGESLVSLHIKCGLKFSLKTTMMLALQLVPSVRVLSSCVWF